MGTLPADLVADLQQRLGLARAVETGTFQGGGARRLAELFPAVVTIELSPEVQCDAAARLRDIPAVTSLLGDSREVLPEVVDPSLPTLYWLDGHWSGGLTGGKGMECPVLEEIAAIASGHADDCVLIDDARLFVAAPPPPHDPAQWPTLMEVFDALRAARADAHVTLLDDVIIAVPRSAKPAVDSFALRAVPADDAGDDSARESLTGRLRRLVSRTP
jgi:hypothetical protein